MKQKHLNRIETTGWDPDSKICPRPRLAGDQRGAAAVREERQHLVNMLVDTNYFTPSGPLGTGDYCLSAGTNEGRDYPTLLKAFPREEKLLIVTDPYNAAIIEKNKAPGQQVEVKQAIPIDQLKRLYENAKAIINPIGEVDFASGHTILLENMSLGRPVIVSMVRGMKDYFQDGVTAIGVIPYDAEDLGRKLRAYLAAPEKFAAIGQQAQEWVRRFSAEEFARKLLVIAARLAGREPVEGEADAKSIGPVGPVGPMKA